MFPSTLPLLGCFLLSIIIISLLFLPTHNVVASSEQLLNNPHVVPVSEKLFHSILSNTAFHVVLVFETKWCHHCRKFKPVYEMVGAFYEDNEDVLLGSVDCEENKELCMQQGIDGFPTVRFYPKKVPSAADREYNHNSGSIPLIEKEGEGAMFEYVSYEGQRDRESIIAWINEKIQEADKISQLQANSNVLHITEKDSFDQLAWDGQHHILLYFYADYSTTCLQFNSLYHDLAELYAKHSNVVLAKVRGYSHQELKDFFGMHTPYPKLVYIPPKEKPSFEEYKGPLSLRSLIDFLNQKTGYRTNVDEELLIDETLKEKLLFDYTLLEAGQDIAVEKEDEYKEQNDPSSHEAVMSKLKTLLDPSQQNGNAMSQKLMDYLADPPQAVGSLLQSKERENRDILKESHLPPIL